MAPRDRTSAEPTSRESAARTLTPVADISRTHYTVLDGLRGLAILPVVVFHFALVHREAHDGHALLQLAQYGWAGVDLFFVLSGFLITGILLETKSGPNFFRNFLMRRFLRIWPLYYAVLAVFLIIAPLVLNPLPQDLQAMRGDQAWFWLYAANWLFAIKGAFQGTPGGYFWSLAVEEQFYLFWPFIVYKLTTHGLLRLCIWLFCLSLLLRLIMLAMGFTTTTVYVVTFTHLEALLTGASLSIILRSADLTAMVGRWIPKVALAVLIGLIAIRIADGNGYYHSQYMAMFGYSLLALGFGCLAARSLATSPTHWWNRFLTSTPMVAAGKYSYALYVVHVPVGSVVAKMTVDRLPSDVSNGSYGLTYAVFFTVAFAVSCGTAFASWHLFEKHILALKKYFQYSSAR